jgi:hypothetical protein
VRVNYERWSKIPYAGEKYPPQNPEEPYASSWPLSFLKRDEDGKFLSPEGEKIKFHIKNPCNIDWEKELDEVKCELDHLTERKIEIAKYWGTGVATKQWTPIIDRLIDTYEVTAPYAGRILQSVQSAINDSFVVTWYLKYKLDVARPNQLDQNMTTLLCTPRHPTYPSGHSVIAACAATVLSHYFPKEAKKLQLLAEECAVSRLYGGVHFPIDNSEALKLGLQIGKMVVSELSRDENNRCELVDKPFIEYKRAKLPPITYEQVIPFNFKNFCQSKVLDHGKIGDVNYHFKKWKTLLQS